MMEMILFVAGGLAGALICFLVMRSQKAAAVNAKTELIGLQRLSSEQQLQQQKDSYEQQLLQQKDSYEQRLLQQREMYEQTLAAANERLQKTAAEQLAAKQEALQLANRQQLEAMQTANRQQMDQLIQPLKEQFAEFKRSVDDSRTQTQVSQSRIQTSFEATMKLFQQEQQQAVAALREQTQRIGSDAVNLTKALRGENKTQGDWGEMVLETMLENSGLRKGEEYFVQASVKDAAGNNLRPDVVVRFPEGRSVIIDSKVSLTAYTDAAAATDEQEQQRLLREHVRSMQRHVDELSAKDYEHVVSDAIGFVLMFVPNESSYIAAMRQQPDLSRYAYQRHIIIISPSNLLMALQLAYNLWQNDRQSRNVEKIVKTASDLYDKVAGFSETFSEVEAQIARLSSTFAVARERLYSGRGNVMRRMESLKKLGIMSKKQIRGIDDTADES